MWHPHPYVLSMAVATLISLALVGFAWRRRPQVGATAFAVFMLGPTIWLGFHVLEVLATDAAAKVLFADLQWVGAVLIPAGLLVYALEYTGRGDWIGPRLLAVLAVEPVVQVGLLATNARYHLLWGEPSLVTVRLAGDPIRLVTADAAVGTYVHVLYTYVALAVGSLLLLGYVFRSHTLYRRQGVAIVVGVVVPWVASVVGLVTSLLFDLMLFGFLVSGITFAVAMFRYGLLDISPVARDAVIDNVSDSVVVSDREGRIVDINPQALRFVDADETEVIGRPATEVFADYADVIERFQNENHPTEEIAVDVNGDTRYFDVDLSPLRDRNGTEVGTILVGRDITDRRQREEQLRDANERLEAFAGVVSHDLRNPLQVAAGNLALAKRDCESEYLDAVGRALDRMDHIIENVLELSRADAEAVDATSVSVATAANSAWETVGTHDATLVVETDREITADPNHLSHLFENLYRNAVEHGSTSPPSQTREDAVEHGGDDVTVTVGALSDGDGFFVADDGPGIPAAERDEVFASGYSTDDGGTGLGLSIVQRIAEAHGWSVSLTESGAGGARFEFHTG